MKGRFLVLGLFVLATACSGASAGPADSVGPSASGVAGTGLPPGCSAIDLHSDTGERVDLAGTWLGSSELTGYAETAWLNQIGNCVYGVVLSGFYNGATGTEGSLANLTGHLGADFAVDFEVVFVEQQAGFRFGEFGAVRMLVEWDSGGRIRLREDREPGEAAARCVQSDLICPDPVIWYRSEDGPPPT